MVTNDVTDAKNDRARAVTVPAKYVGCHIGRSVKKHLEVAKQKNLCKKEKANLMQANNVNTL